MSDTVARIGAMGLVPVVELGDAADALALVDALIAGGLDCIEVTLRTAAGLDAIAAVAEAGRAVVLAAGTVLTVEQARAATERGAQALISPGSSRPVIDWALEHDVPVIPGVSTPTEIEAGMAAGLDVFKFFPAEASGGTRFLRAMQGPYPGVRFMPTGGIDAANLAGYLAQSNVLACGGSWMVARSLLDARDFDAVRRRTAEAVDIVAAARRPGAS